ncbi:MAG: 5-deoxy-glucuronate isomerase, partial [Bauldia sp.]
MPRLHLRQSQPDRAGRVIRVTPKNAGWTYVGFDLHRLAPGEAAGGKIGEREVCLLFVS